MSGGSPGGCPPASAGPGCRLSRLCHVAQGPQLPRRGQEHIRVPPTFLGLSPEATSLLPAISQSQRRRSPAQLRGAGRCGARAPGEQWAFPGTATLRSRGTRKPLGSVAGFRGPGEPRPQVPRPHLALSQVCCIFTSRPGPQGLRARRWCRGLRLPTAPACTGGDQTRRRAGKSPSGHFSPRHSHPARRSDEPPLRLPQ